MVRDGELLPAGREARHNLGYWHGEDYLGLGIGAVSTTAGVRWRNRPSLAGYLGAIAAGRRLPRDEELLEPEVVRRERLMLGSASTSRPARAGALPRWTRRARPDGAPRPGRAAGRRARPHPARSVPRRRRDRRADGRKDLQKVHFRTMADAQELRLSQRQELILARVVEEYVSTGSPVGSKTLVERTGPGRLLVDGALRVGRARGAGTLTHPHTSAGRVPTDAGYRLFVDRLLDRLEARPGEPRPRPLGPREPGGLGATGDDRGAGGSHAPARARVGAAAGDDDRAPRRGPGLQPHVAMVVVITSTGVARSGR